MARAQAGEPEAFVTLLHRHDGVLRALAWQVLRDSEAMDEVMGQVFRKAYLGIGGFREGASARAWLSKLTWAACAEELRAHRRAGRERPFPPVGDELDDALVALSPEQRATVMLVDAEGYRYQDAARVLGTPPDTVAGRLAEARALLRRALDAQGSR